MSTPEEHVVDLLARANPVRPEELEPPAALLAAIVGRPSRTRRRLPGRSLRVAVPALAVAALALALVGSLLVTGGRAPSALAIERTDEYISLRIEDPTASAEEMNRELRERGIDVEVETVPVPPDEVGDWVGGRAVWPKVPEGMDQHRLGDDRIRELNDAARLMELVRPPDDPGLIRVPADFKGHVLLYAGRAVRPGEKPWIKGNPPGAR